MSAHPVSHALGDASVSGIPTLLNQLLRLREDIVQEATGWLQRFTADFPEGRFTPSAVNLAHYLALRRRDLRPLQDQLAALGLSSLGRGESHILDNLNRVVDILAYGFGTVPPPAEAAIDGAEGRRLLENHAAEVFGRAPSARTVRIMVTLPSGAATDAALVEALLAGGMNCARINCAYDDCAAWDAMIANLRRAEQVTGHSCRVLMDLAGQKIRTGPIEAPPPLMRLKPSRDRFGVVTDPAIVPLLADDGRISAPSVSPTLRIPPAVHSRLQTGDRFSFQDSRGKRRYLDVVEIESTGTAIAECRRGAWLTDGTRLAWQRRGADGRFRTRGYLLPGALPAAAGEVRLMVGETLLLTGPELSGRPAQFDPAGHLVGLARLACSHAGILAQMKPGHQVWFDDGKLGARVERTDGQSALLQVTHGARDGTAIRADKGINFPDLALHIAPLTEKDLRDLDFIARRADAVGYSFVQAAGDMQLLIDELEKRGAAQLPIIAKIETQRAVVNLPEIVMSTIGRHPFGVMIARGDLAVEIGNARLAEIQEEILWLCEAAHVPVVWATQVLETMAKKGIRSRPELTDAAMGVRAECVMLNKGPYILDALDVLDSILTRMEAHQRKKHSRLRALHW